MTYKMECFRCKADMEYIKNKEMEKMDWITMKCPKCRDNEYLVPKENPDLIKIK